MENKKKTKSANCPNKYFFFHSFGNIFMDFRSEMAFAMYLLNWIFFFFTWGHNSKWKHTSPKIMMERYQRELSCTHRQEIPSSEARGVCNAAEPWAASAAAGAWAFKSLGCNHPSYGRRLCIEGPAKKGWNWCPQSIVSAWAWLLIYHSGQQSVSGIAEFRTLPSLLPIHACKRHKMVVFPLLPTVLENPQNLQFSFVALP